LGAPERGVGTLSVIADLLIRGGTVCTLAGDRAKGAVAALDAVSPGAVAIAKGKIAWVGPDAEVSSHIEAAPSCETIDATGQLVLPGFVDCHTHLVFAGERADEFRARCAGSSYQEIAAKGGGILSTVVATRAASEDQLVELAVPRLRRLLGFGVTTAEVKSGYGLSVVDELKMLRAVRGLGSRQPLELVPTLLCAHAVPAEYSAARDRYVRLCVDEIIPAVAEAKLAVFCDAFVEQGAFTTDEVRTILGAGRKHGLRPRLHVDQMSAGGGAELAAELGAATADHLEQISTQGIEALRRANVTAVLCPTSTFYLRMDRYAPGRALWDAGVNIALATNVNPGSAMSENLSLAISLACLRNGLSPEEAIYAATRGGAEALGISDRVGSLVPGKQADVVVHGAPSPAHLAYHLGVSHVRCVVKAGRIVAQPGPTTPPAC
jgi:imidazolonepropionase